MDNIMYQQYNNKYLQKFFTNDYDYMPKPKSRNSSNIKNNLNNKLQLNIMGNNSVDDKIQYNFNIKVNISDFNPVGILILVPFTVKSV